MKKKIINIVLCTSFAFLCGILITLSGKESNENTGDLKNRNSVDIYRPQPAEVVQQETPPAPADSYFLLINEGELLMLYEISEENKTTIKQTDINTGILPPEDRIKLEQGIKLSTAEEAYSLIEDFSS